MKIFEEQISNKPTVARVARWFFSVFVFIFPMQILAATDAVQTTTETQPEEIKTIKFGPQDAEYLRKSGLAGKFLRMLESPAALGKDSLNEIDFAVRDIAFYRMSDRQNRKFTRNFYETLEQKMVGKFTQVTRFAVHECFECKVTRVVLQKGQFQVLRQWDSNQTLYDIGRKIGVDHFALWDAYEEHGQAVINLRVVSSQNGQVRWNHQFRSGEIAKEPNWEVYTSFWNIDSNRSASSGGGIATVSTFMSIGIRSLDRSTISEKIYYGYGMETFFNTVNRDQINMFGLTLHGRALLEIDKLIGFEQKDYGNWMLYGDIGQAFLKTTPSLSARAGLEIRPSKRYFLDAGVVYFLTKSYDVSVLSGYQDTATFGGLGYDVTLGYRY